jgi:hypothetical protein
MNSGKYFGETKRTNDTRKRKPTKVFSKNKKSKNKCFRNDAKKSCYDLRSKHHSWVSKKKKSFSQTSRYDFRSRKDFNFGRFPLSSIICTFRFSKIFPRIHLSITIFQLPLSTNHLLLIFSRLRQVCVS